MITKARFPSLTLRNYFRLFSVLLKVFLIVLPGFAVWGNTKAEEKIKTLPVLERPSVLTQLFEDVKKTRNCKHLQTRLSGLGENRNIVKTISLNLNSHLKQTNPNFPNKEKEREIIEFLHRSSHCMLQKLKPVVSDQRLSWEKLADLSAQPVSAPYLQRELFLLWISYIQKNYRRLSTLYQIPFALSETVADTALPYVRFQNALLTPSQASMWKHCQKRFNKISNVWRAKIISGFMSPAYQFVTFLNYNIDLKTSLIHFPAPGYGNFQKAAPNIRFKLVNKAKKSSTSPWKSFYQSCAEFGIEKAYPELKNLEGTARILGIDDLYRDIFSNPLIPKYIVRDLPGALQASDFYPSPQGLRVILALSAQESTIQWNPKLNEQKKDLLRKRFDNILSKINESIPESVSSFFLSEDHKRRLEELISELHHLTDPKQEQTREYDFFLWSRKTYTFINELKGEYKQMAKVGQWFFDLQSLNIRLEKEPQTFGLWQINVNHLQEKIKSFKQLRRAFPEIYQKTNGKWIVNRRWLIDALSGRPHARLNRRRTLELIIHTHLKPHYENHMLGEKNDLMYFIAENMAGEMSTFRAAVQKELNEKMRSSLKTDGDLTYYLPYSTKIDWKKESLTYKKLKEFISNHQYYFDKPLDSIKLIRDLCQASSWKELSQLELFRKLFDKNSAIRIYPNIRSNLYNQTPYAYAKLVMRKSQLF